jgi:hypothetical protein
MMTRLRRGSRLARWCSLVVVFACARPEAPATSAPRAPATIERVLILDQGLPVGIDELRYSRELMRVVAPAGGTGKLLFFEPANLARTEVAGFSATAAGKGHGHGVTSVSTSEGLLFATDRDRKELVMLATADWRVLANAHLAAAPDYVRYVERTHEVWVTEPHAAQIEVFTIGPTSLVHVATVHVEGGPESLEIMGERAFTHLWKGQSLAIDVASRKLGTPFANHCEGSRGLVIDHARGFVLAGCEEGKLVVLNQDGAVLSEVKTDPGVDNLAYSETRKHAYAPTESHNVTSVIAIDDNGLAREVGRVNIGSQCAAADDEGNMWLCDPNRGTITVVHDRFLRPDALLARSSISQSCKS